MRSSDSYLVNVLDKLEETGLLDDTLIVRTADHGEMGLTHGGMRQKNFNFYEEATRVPLVYSNPKLFPKPAQTDALVSHVDFLPTLASLAAAPKSGPRQVAGGRLLEAGPAPARRRKPVQDYVVFTYDDFQSGQATGPTRNRRTTSSASAKGAGSSPSTTTSSRKPEAAAVGDVRPEDGPAGEEEPRLQRLRTHRGQEKQFQRLKRKLARVEKTRLQPLKRPSAA